MRFINITLFSLVFLVLPGLLLGNSLETSTSNSDSVLHIKSPRAYFRPTIYSSVFTTPSSPIRDNQSLTGSYRYHHTNTGYLVPLFTQSWLRNDGVSISNFHVLTGANYLQSVPDYSQIPLTYSLYKFSWGLRMIYNTGKKNIWFANFSPFISQDDRTFGKPVMRYAAVLVFNRTVSKNFSYRFGYYRSYLLGGKFVHFPLVGLRFGPHDGINFSLQFPKYAAFSFPMGEKFRAYVFARPSGSIFNFSDYAGKSDVVQFRRYEMLIGYLINYKLSRNISINVGSGYAGNRYISYADNTGSTGNELFQSQIKVKGGMFFTAGVFVRFGKAIPVNGNINMYDAFDLNSSFDPADHNESIIPNNIPGKDASLKKIQYKDIQDLLSEDDIN